MEEDVRLLFALFRNGIIFPIISRRILVHRTDRLLSLRRNCSRRAGNLSKIMAVTGKDGYLTNVQFEEYIPSSDFVHLSRITFTREDRTVKWDLSLRPDSVACVIYHRDKNALLFVKQFRPAIFVARVRSLPENVGKENSEINWAKYPVSTAQTIELCAGLIDKNGLSDIGHMREEIEEECGYRVPESNIRLLKRYITGIGVSGAVQMLYYAEIDESMKISDGGGVDNEKIEKVYMGLDEAKDYLEKTEVLSAPGLLYGLCWFFSHKPHLLT